jgi:AcrR family transcriptional regulator
MMECAFPKYSDHSDAVKYLDGACLNGGAILDWRLGGGIMVASIQKRRSKQPAKPRRIDVARRAAIGQEKRARTRAALLQAAFQLVGHERGLMTRIEEVCEAAQIARGTFYNYFDSVEELWDALSDELNHEFNRSVVATLSEITSAAERAGFAIRFYLERARRDTQWAWAMVHISARGPIFGQDTYEHAHRTAEEGIASGEFDLPGPNTGRDLQLGTTLAGMVTQLRKPPSSTYAASVARHVLWGMGVPRERVEEIVSKPLPLLTAAPK